MALTPVPWAVGHGAHNEVEGARLSLYAATSGARGVIAPADMRVTALPVPGGAVRIHQGACVTPNDYSPASSQSYGMREESSTDFPVDPTGSAGGAVRYLVARVKDDQYAGQAPENVQNGPYNAYQWLSTDPRTNPPAFPHTPLVKLNQPANTATINQSMLEDIRVVANPRSKTDRFPRPVVFQNMDGFSHELRAKRNGTGDERGEQFPDSRNGGRFDSYVPLYATRMHLTVDWTSVMYDGRSSWGGFYIRYVGKDGVGRSTQDFGWDVAEGTIQSTNWLLRDNLFIPWALRDGPISFYLMAFVEDATTATQGAVRLSKRSGLLFDVTYHEVADWTGV